MKEEQMKVGMAAGIFSSINSTEFSEDEKMDAIKLIIGTESFRKYVRREGLFEVIQWLLERCQNTGENRK